MAEIADILKVQDGALGAKATEKGLDLDKYKSKEELAGALSPLVTPEEIAELPQVEAGSESEGNDEGSDGNGSNGSDGSEDNADGDDENTEDTDESEGDDEGEKKPEFPKTVHVRLAKGYPLQQPHGRAGIILSPGPQPVTVDVTEEQLEALNNDRYIEIVTDEEVALWNEHHAAISGTPDKEPEASRAPETTLDDVNNAGSQPTGGRRYDTGVNGGVDPNAKPVEVDTKKAGVPEIPKGPEPKTNAEVVARAQQLGVTPVRFVKTDLLKKAIKTAEKSGADVANKELADAIADAKKNGSKKDK